MLNVGLIGYGTAGKDVAGAILGGQAGNTRLAAVLVRNAAKYADVALDDCLITDSEAAFFERRPDVVVETAGHEAVIRYAESSLAHDCDFMVVSVGAFCDEALYDRVMASASRHGKRVLVPSAAIAGLDRIAAAAQGPLDRVTLTTRKPVKAWRGTFAEEVVDLDTVAQPTVIFEGNARESSRVFPESVNVSAALSLAGIGFEATQVRVLVDPTIDKNVHEVSAKGRFGEVRIEVQNTPSPNNPKTGYIVAMSVARALKNLSSPLVIG
ncbi:aspartate dehydrogenase [Billgrantia kenyensis]|uniref:L-aspartate dehydrogenase n=1 Tax=Billgrantia kenyensis TaxID=321266 RepID=A0A7W0AD03_9GAMM|nr:aspartate dehydrogenase [Halomonas kenyensis]MBA2778060.1 aspartate dehydrogenase [Halomonas kenyensis]MCG6661161.1 aspartate dehydrogenase [Halomonas kenyensis]